MISTFSGLLRWGFTKNISLEAGLSYIKRNFDTEYSINYDSIVGTKDLSIVTYEFPIQVLTYVRLGEQFHMNASTGISLNFRASSVGSTSDDFNFSQLAYIKKLNLAYIANLGFEYRTKESGYFYLGASLTTLLRPLGRIELRSLDDNNFKNVFGELSGNYISVDLRYFFNDKKEK